MFKIVLQFLPTFNAVGTYHPKEINTQNAKVAIEQPEISENSYSKIFNKKAAHLIAELLAKTTLISDLGNLSENLHEKANFVKKFRMLNKHLDNKSDFDITEIKELLNSFFQFLSEANDGKEPAPEQNQHKIYKIFKEDKDKSQLSMYELGLQKVLGIHLESELNKLCKNYKKTNLGNSETYDKMCEQAAKDIKEIWHDIELSWNLQCISHCGSQNIAEQRKLYTIIMAKKLLFKIWFLALNYALVAMDICYFHSRILFWKEKEKTRKVANLHKYHPGMTELEYLAYWLLTLLPQVEPGFNIRDYTRDPYKKLGVKVTDVKLRKKTKIHGHAVNHKLIEDFSSAVQGFASGFSGSGLPRF